MNVATNPVEPEDDIPPKFRIPDPKDVFKGELVQHGEWIVANISTDSFWPITSQKVRWHVNRLPNLTPHRLPILTPLRGGVCWSRLSRWSWPGLWRRYG
jgi:hypothetical protein